MDKPEKDDYRKSKKTSGTSGNREESMTESDNDAFGSATSSGTESLGGEGSGSGERRGPGGVEGETGES